MNPGTLAYTHHAFDTYLWPRCGLEPSHSNNQHRPVQERMTARMSGDIEILNCNELVCVITTLSDIFNDAAAYYVLVPRLNRTGWVWGARLREMS